ncbi:MAG: AIM24 family protein [Candidatus Micrarchaeia archaeon]
MDYQIIGSSMQMLNIKLNAGEKIYVDGSKVASRSDNVMLNAKWGGGAGFFKGVEMAFAGSTAFLLEGTAQSDNGLISLAGIIPGKIKVVELKEGESMYVEHFAFLATNDPTRINVKASWRGALSGAGIFLERFDGPCTVFMHVSGDIIEYDLDEGATMNIDPGHLAAFSGDMQVHFGKAGSLKAEFFGGEGFWMAKLQGPGKVIMHSVSRLRLAESLNISKGTSGAGGSPTAAEVSGAAGLAGAALGILDAMGKEKGPAPRFKL